MWEDGKLGFSMDDVDQAQWKFTKVAVEELLWNLRTSCCNKCMELTSHVGGWNVAVFDEGC